MCQNWGTVLHLSRSVLCSAVLSSLTNRICLILYFLQFCLLEGSTSVPLRIFSFPISNCFTFRMRSSISIDIGCQTVKEKYILRTYICNSMAERCTPYVSSSRIQDLPQTMNRDSFLMHVGSQRGAKMELWGWLGMKSYHLVTKSWYCNIIFVANHLYYDQCCKKLKIVSRT